MDYQHTPRAHLLGWARFFTGDCDIPERAEDLAYCDTYIGYALGRERAAWSAPGLHTRLTPEDVRIMTPRVERLAGTSALLKWALTLNL